MARVIISTGHTSYDPGTVANGFREVDVARIIAKKVTPYLRANGIITLAVPYDLDLLTRINWINNTGYKDNLNDILVEIHLNDGGKSGLEAWYVDSLERRAEKLAEVLADVINKRTGLAIQGINNEIQHPFGGIRLLKQTKPVSVLLECLYLDNESDLEFIRNDSKLELLAKSIAEGIAKYLGVNFNPNVQGDNTAAQPAKNNQPIKNRQSQDRQSQDQQPKDLSAKDQSGQKTIPEPYPVVQMTPVSRPNQPVPQVPSYQPSQPMSSYQSPQPAKINMTREERKDMIVKYYRKAFGAEPKQADLNYFLNIGISEEQLTKRIFESQDLQTQIENARKYTEMKTQFSDISSKAEALEQQLNDQRDILEKLNSLLLQKNYALSEMQKRIQYLLLKLEEIQAAGGEKEVKVEYKRSAVERFFNFLSQKLS